LLACLSKTTSRLFSVGSTAGAEGDLTEFDGLYAPDSRGQRAREWWNQLVVAWRVGFSDFRYHVEDLVTDGDIVAANTVFSGTHDGIFNLRVFRQPIPPTGRQVSVREIAFFWLVEGKIAQITTTWEEIRFQKLLGINPDVS
jgi:predicted ester cyclase